jgi:5-methylcytosine-specific restriction protein A
MIIIKNDFKTLEGVLRNQKHASFNNLQFQPNEIILIQQTITSLNSPAQKSIRWIMNYVETYLDVNNESDLIWGRHWNYIIKGANLRPVEGFNISDIQFTNQNYKAAVTHAYVNLADEEVIMDWINDINPIQGENDELALEFEQENRRDINRLLEILNFRYANQPNYKQVIAQRINRPTALKKAIIERDGTTCKLCGHEGFLKRTGEVYCEIHHMIELNALAPNTLQSWNLLILCPTCHRQMHYGNVRSEFLNPGWRVIVDDIEHLILP